MGASDQSGAVLPQDSDAEATQQSPAVTGPDSWGAEVPSQITAESTAEPSQTADYICNTNTGKFHYPDCDSVNQMSEKNKLPVNTTREELINQGYVPCKKCNP